MKQKIIATILSIFSVFKKTKDEAEFNVILSKKGLVINKVFLQTLLILLLFSYKTYGQDPQYSQFYAATMELGPSFAGSSPSGARVILNFRDQWPQVPKEFITYSVSADLFSPRYNSGVGMFVLRDRAGSGFLASNNIGLQYAYFLNINKDIQFRPGLQVSYYLRNVDYNSLIFGDQLSFYGIKPVSTEYLTTENVSIVDASVSGLFFTSKFWLGFSFSHLPFTNVTFTGNENTVPMKFSVYGGTKLTVRERFLIIEQEYLYLSFLYKKQELFQQLDMGAYYERHPITLGLWYRGLPFVKSYEEYMIHDALIAKLGFTYENMTFRYSYDFTVSKIRAVTGGAHEVSMVLYLNYRPNVTKKANRSLPCPEF